MHQKYYIVHCISQYSSLSLPPPPQALVDISSNEGWLGVALKVMQLIQMCVQGRWLSNSSLLTLPHFDESVVAALNSALGGVRKQLSWQSGLKELATLPELMVACEHDRNFLNFALKGSLSRENISQVKNFFLYTIVLQHFEPYNKIMCT